MTGSDFRDYVVQTFRRTDKDTLLYQCVTDTVKAINVLYSFNDMKVEAYCTTGISGGTDYRIELPEDFGHLISDLRLINGDDSKVLKKLSKEQFDIEYPNLNYASSTTARPKHYCLWGYQILIAPLPDLTTYTYELSYTRKIKDSIVAGTTDVPFTTDDRETVMYGTLYRLYSRLGNDEEAQKWKALQDAGIQTMIKNDMGNTTATRVTAYNDF